MQHNAYRPRPSAQRSTAPDGGREGQQSEKGSLDDGVEPVLRQLHVSWALQDPPVVLILMQGARRPTQLLRTKNKDRRIAVHI